MDYRQTAQIPAGASAIPGGSALDTVQARLKTLFERGHEQNCRIDALLDNILGAEPQPADNAAISGGESPSRIPRVMRLLDELEASTEWRQRLIARLERV